MRVAIICEGSTDFAILEHIALRIAAASECKLLQPDFDQLSSGAEPMFAPGWQGGNLPENVIIILPREETESWIIAAHTNIKWPEREVAPDELLAQKGILPRERGRVVKKEERYRELAPAISRLIKDKKGLSAVPELERAVNKMQRAARAHRKR